MGELVLVAPSMAARENDWHGTRSCKCTRTDITAQNRRPELQLLWHEVLNWKDPLSQLLR